MELFWAENEHYPLAPSPGLVLGTDVAKCLSEKGYGASCESAETLYMGMVPSGALPVDGSCTEAQNEYRYISENGSDYTLTFCTSSTIGSYPPGPHTANPEGIK